MKLPQVFHGTSAEVAIAPPERAIPSFRRSMLCRSYSPRNIRPGSATATYWSGMVMLERMLVSTTAPVSPVRECTSRMTGAVSARICPLFSRIPPNIMAMIIRLIEGIIASRPPAVRRRSTMLLPVVPA